MESQEKIPRGDKTDPLAFQEAGRADRGNLRKLLTRGGLSGRGKFLCRGVETIYRWKKYKLFRGESGGHSKESKKATLDGANRGFERLV